MSSGANCTAGPNTRTVNVVFSTRTRSEIPGHAMTSEFFTKYDPDTIWYPEQGKSSPHAYCN